MTADELLPELLLMDFFVQRKVFWIIITRDSELITALC